MLFLNDGWIKETAKLAYLDFSLEEPYRASPGGFLGPEPCSFYSNRLKSIFDVG